MLWHNSGVTVQNEITDPQNTDADLTVEQASSAFVTSVQQEITPEKVVSPRAALALFELATSSIDTLREYHLERNWSDHEECNALYSQAICAYVIATRVSNDPSLPDSLQFVGEMYGKVNPFGFGVGWGWGTYAQGNSFTMVEDICSRALETDLEPALVCSSRTTKQGVPYTLYNSTNEGYLYREGAVYGYIFRQIDKGRLYYGFRWENGDVEAAKRFMEALEFVQ